jgi:hypothetical protein
METTDFSVGDVLVLTERISGDYVGGMGVGCTFEVGTEVKVQKVNSASIWLRGKRLSPAYYEREVVSMVVPWGSAAWSVVEASFSADPSERPRKLGEVPEGSIPVDDPRIAWIWEDAAKVATRSNHCGEYDKLCDELGIPGRERSFTVNREINGFKVSKSFKARSRKLAEDLFDSELKSALV